MKFHYVACRECGKWQVSRCKEDEYCNCSNDYTDSEEDHQCTEVGLCGECGRHFLYLCDGVNPVAGACGADDLESLQYLMSEGQKVSWPCVRAAAVNGSNKCLQFLAAKKLVVPAALRLVAGFGHLDALRILLDAGVQHRLDTPSLTVFTGKKECFDLLMERRYKTSDADKSDE